MSRQEKKKQEVPRVLLFPPSTKRYIDQIDLAVLPRIRMSQTYIGYVTSATVRSRSHAKSRRGHV